MVLIVVFLNGNLVRFLCPAARLAKCPNSRCNNGLQETSVECCFEWESSSILVLRNFEMAWISEVARKDETAHFVKDECLWGCPSNTGWQSGRWRCCGW